MHSPASISVIKLLLNINCVEFTNINLSAMVPPIRRYPGAKGVISFIRYGFLKIETLKLSLPILPAFYVKLKYSNPSAISDESKATLKYFGLVMCTNGLSLSIKITDISLPKGLKATTKSDKNRIIRQTIIVHMEQKDFTLKTKKSH